MRKYRSIDAVSQSELKTLLYDPTQFFEERKVNYTRPRHFELGTAVDEALAYNLSEAAKNAVKIERRPEHKLGQMVEYLIGNDLEPNDENILEARQAVNYDRRLTDNTVLSKFEAVMWYYNTLLELKEHQYLLTEDDWNACINIYYSLTTNRYTKEYVRPSDLNVIRLNHVYIVFEYMGVRCKAELDQINVDIQNRIITPIDYKTIGGGTREFKSSCKKRRYDIQAACYTLAMEKLKDGQEIETNFYELADLSIEGFKVMPFKFIVETTNPEKIGCSPLVFDVSKEMLLGGLFGTYVNRSYVSTGMSPDMFGGIPNNLVYSQPLIPGFHNLVVEYLYQRSLPEEERGYTMIEDLELKDRGSISLSIW